MRFKNVEIQNFRVFVDEALKFSRNSDKNVTVIHGQNGSGKTTFLNAIKWVLYGTVDFELGTDRLANQGQMAKIDSGESLTVRVDLSFEHDNNAFELLREATYKKESSDDLAGKVTDENVVLKKESESGRLKQVNNPKTQVEQIVPERLSNLFLFDGEYINRISGMNDEDEIKEAIQNIMGLTILERATDHLESVENRFEEEIKKHGSDELKELIKQKQERRGDIGDIETKIGDKKESRQTLLTEIQDIESKLERIGKVAKFQEERKEKEKRVSQLRKQKEELTNEIQSEISKKGYLPFSMGAIEETAKDIDRLRQEGKIPSELDNQFVDELLTDGACICGRPLDQNSESYQKVANYKDDTPDGVDTAAIQLITRIGSLQETYEEFFDTIKEKVGKRQSVIQDIEDLEEKIDELGHKISGTEGYDPETDESPSELETSRQEKIEKRARLKEQIDQLNVRKSELENEIEEIQDKIEEARENVKEAALARKRMKAAQTVRQDIEESFAELQQRVRSWSNDRVKNTFEDVARKSDYVAHITDEFELKIREGIGGNEVEVQKSRGERQISSLAFIGSLVSIAKERYEEDSKNRYFSGGIYPIVMDSPFGALDKDHRREISRVIPELADQVVVMVTDGQWDGPVENEMSSITGSEYSLEYDPGNSNSFPRTRIVPEKESPKRGE